jgi:hypothetical protein
MRSRGETVTHPAVTNSKASSARSASAVFAQLSSRAGSSEKGAVVAKHRAGEGRPACRAQTLPDNVSHEERDGFVWAFRDEVEVPAHTFRCRKERRGELDAGPAGQLRRCQGIADRAQVIELTLVGEQPPEQPANDVLVNLRFGSQPLDERAQIPLAAVKLLRLSSELSKLPARLRRLVAKARDLQLLLAGLRTKPSEVRSAADRSSVTGQRVRRRGGVGVRARIGGSMRGNLPTADFQALVQSSSAIQAAPLASDISASSR